MSDRAEIYQQHKEGELCTWSGDSCQRPHAPDSSLCEKHLRKKRKANRERNQRIRDERRENGECLYCLPTNGKPAKVVAPETSCVPCRIRRGRLAGVNPPTLLSEDERAARIASATVKGEDGRLRYHGQRKRGSQPVLQLDDQDVALTLESIRAGQIGLHLYEQAVAARAPIIQREDLKSAALHQLSRAQDHLDEILGRRGYFKSHVGKRHGPRDGE